VARNEAPNGFSHVHTTTDLGDRCIEDMRIDPRTGLLHLLRRHLRQAKIKGLWKPAILKPLKVCCGVDDCHNARWGPAGLTRSIVSSNQLVIKDIITYFLGAPPGSGGSGGSSERLAAIQRGGAGSSSVAIVLSNSLLIASTKLS
jgi:hypothetical protein